MVFLSSNPDLNRSWFGGSTHTECIGQKSKQDAQTHDRCEDSLQYTCIQEETYHEANHAEVHAPEEHIVSPGPERAPFFGHNQNQAEKRVGHDTNKHRMIQGKEEPGWNYLEAGIKTSQYGDYQVGEDSHIHDDEDGAECKEAIARACYPAKPQDRWSKAYNVDENTNQFEQYVHTQQCINVEQGANRQHQARDEGEGYLNHASSGQLARIWLEAPFADRHPYKEQIADHLGCRMCGEGTRWKERIIGSELNLQEHADHAPNDERKQCAE